MIHFADAPCHGKQYHSGCSDDYPTGPHKFDLTAEGLFNEMIKKDIDYCFMSLTNTTDIMIQEFRKLYDDKEKRREIQVKTPDLTSGEVSVTDTEEVVYEKKKCKIQNRG